MSDYGPIGSEDPFDVIREQFERMAKQPNCIAMHEQTYQAYEEVRIANRRPTGKRAQRRAGKEWNR